MSNQIPLIIVMEPRTSADPTWNVRVVADGVGKMTTHVLVAGFNARAAIKDQDFTHWQAPDAIKEAK